jgi:hypothetical protein
LKTKIFSTLKKALAYYNNGVVAVNPKDWDWLQVLDSCQVLLGWVRFGD